MNILLSGACHRLQHALQSTGKVWDAARSWERDGASGSCAEIAECSGDVRYSDCYIKEAVFSAVSRD